MNKIIGLGIVLLLCVTNVGAVELGVGAKVGTNGVGIDLSVGLTKTINARLSAAALDFDDNNESITVGD